MGAIAVALGLACVVVAGGFLIAGFGGGSAQATRQFTLRSANDSGVTGTVTLTAVGADRTSVRVEVDPASHGSMPAHVHPGTCANPVPQPRYPLENIVEGHSTTEIPTSIDQLLADPVSINLHKSNEQMQISTACVDLR